jgi:TPR repeat protein
MAMRIARTLAGMAVLLASIGLRSTNAQELERAAPACSKELIDKAQSGADRGEPASMYLLARYYSTGHCIKGDGKKAIELYTRAAELGYPPAFYNLGIISAANRDYKTAEFLFKRGAELGHRGAEIQLGILYSFPIPNIGDNTKAFAWLSLAASRPGDAASEAKDILGKVNSKLTPPERRQGERLFNELTNRYGTVPEFKPQ